MSYKTIYIPKRSGGVRRISIPSDELKLKQRKILHELYKENYDPMFSFGFIPGRSIYHNARVHAGKKFILNLDIENFFDSCRIENAPPVIKEIIKKYGVDNLFYNGSLPQGAPTSPFLANLYMIEVDMKIFVLLRIHISSDIRYTRYADDITISSNSKAIFGKSTMDIIRSVLASAGFKINYKKVRRMTPSSKQEITGAVINSGVPTVSKRVRRLLRAMVHKAKPENIGKINGMISFMMQFPAHREFVKNMREKLALKIKEGDRSSTGQVISLASANSL